MVKKTGNEATTAPAQVLPPPPGIVYCERVTKNRPCGHCGQRYTRICAARTTVGRVRGKLLGGYGPRHDNGHASCNSPGNKRPPLPDRPTSAVPGSEEKIAVMEARFASNQAIFHPDDLNLHPGAHDLRQGRGIVSPGYDLTPSTDDESHTEGPAGAHGAVVEGKRRRRHGHRGSYVTKSKRGE